MVEKVLAGDPCAFSTIIKNTEALVALVMYKMTNNREGRKDIAQEVYLKAYKNIAGFRFESKLSTWIARSPTMPFLTILKNNCCCKMILKHSITKAPIQPGRH